MVVATGPAGVVVVTSVLVAAMAAVIAAGAVLLWWRPTRPPWTPGVGELPDDDLTRGKGVTVVPEALELVALALQGGGSLGEATVSVASVLPGRRREELALVGASLRHGTDPTTAWVDAGPDWDPARRCLELAAVAGVAPAPALRQAADDLRRDAVADVELATARLGVRLVLPLGLTFLPAFVLTTVLPLVLALTRELAW